MLLRLLIIVLFTWRFTQRNMLRIYPKGIRFDSSNYNPLIGWMHGAQMVAFNMQVQLLFRTLATQKWYCALCLEFYLRLSNKNFSISWCICSNSILYELEQGYGRSLWVMQGMFRANGGCGYVKKPDFLLKSGNEVFNPRATLPVKTTLKVGC